LARALINHPKVLLLDEPLGALDQLTRMQMQDEVLRFWQARGMTMVLVTHYVDEAIYMSDRIYVMTPRPGRIVRVVDVPLERPRERNSPQFMELRAEILEMLHFAEKGAQVSNAASLNGQHKSRVAAPGNGHAPHSTVLSDLRVEAQAVVAENRLA
jgi:ABC-type nitrate/sulfonate/bicarbonate transport system ATPase subunit